MEFRVLGPLELRTAAGAIPIDARKRRELLAILLLNPNEPLTASRLQHELWGEAAPSTAANTLQVHVSRLRKLLAEAGADATLVSEPGGYALRLDPELIDAQRFLRLLEDAAAQADPAARARTLHAALELWRGAALADIVLEGPSAILVDRLDHARVVAIEDRIDAELECGRHAAIVPELEALVAEHPFRERLRAQLMLALYRAGRQVDALEAYRAARTTLADELGIDPGPELRRLETAILRHDPALDQPLARPEAAESEHPEVRKTVTAVAARVALAEETDPEIAALPLEQAVAELEEVLVDAGATVERRTGDEVVAVFGVPAVHEDDAIRAATAALQLVERAGRASAGRGVSARAGVATGDVLASGTRVRGGVPLGEAVRLREAAPPGEVWIDEATHRLLGEAARASRIARQHGWHLRALEEPRAGRSRARGPLVGRTRELEELVATVESATSGATPTLVELVGAPGVGKTRVVAELGAQVRRRARVVAGRCLPYGEGITFWPLLEMVRDVIGDGDGDRLAEVYGDDPDAAGLAAVVGGAVGLGPATEPSAATDVFVAVRKLFERLAHERPLVVVVEDAHWAEPTFLELIEHVVLEAGAVPITVLAVARDEPELRWSESVPVTTLRLEPLPAEAASELVAVRAGKRSLDADVAETVVTNAGGNPLFIEQLVAVVKDGGDPSQIPVSLRGLLAARLDLLEPQELVALQAASVIGLEVWKRALAELADGVDDLEPVTERLVEKELLQPASATLAGEEALRFRHLLIHDAAYESLPKAARSRLHERLAVWLESTAEAARLDEIVGYHYEQSAIYRRELGDADGARDTAARGSECLVGAGQRAAARSDVPAALNLLGRGIALLPPDHPRRAELLTDLADLHRERGEFEAADTALAEALALAAAAGDESSEHAARIASVRMRGVTDPSSLDELVPVVEQAIPVFEASGNDRRLSQAWGLLGWLAWLRCTADEATARFERAVEHARKSGDEREEVAGLHFLIGAALFGPLPVPDAIRRCEEIVALRPGARRLVASSLRARGMLAAMEGRFDEAYELVDRDAEILADLGLRVVAASARDQYGWVHLLAGDVAGAEAEWTAGLETFERMGEKAHASTLAALAAEAAYRRGDLDTVLRLTARSEAGAARDDLHTQIQWRGPRAKALVRRGETDEAVRLVREALELAAGTDFLGMRAAASLDAADVFTHGGLAVEAAAAAQASVGWFTRKGNVVQATEAQGVLTGLESAEGRQKSAFSDRSGAVRTVPK